jgi:hypothetical protein
MQLIGKYLVIFGIFMLITGLILYFFSNYFSWLGRLPGDIRVEKDNFRLYFPITSMVLISIILTIVINLIKKFL